MIRIPGSIPISIYPLFWLLAAAIGWLNTSNFFDACLWIAIIFVSVLVHEYGHALTAIFFGQKAKIDLVAMGGVTHRRGSHLKLWQDFIVVFNGPLAGLTLGFLALIIKENFIPSGSSSHIAYALQVTFYINIFWTILNLVPIQPLDGGKLLNIILESLFGLKGVKIGLFISMALAAMLGMLFFSIHAVFAGLIFMMFAFESYTAWKYSLAVTDQDKNSTIQHLFKEAERDMLYGNKEAALNKFMRIRDLAQSGIIFVAASELAAKEYSEKGDSNTAFELLMPISHKLSPDALQLLHQLAYRQGKWQEAVSLGTRSYQSNPNYNTALLNAFSLAALGQAYPAIGWLQCAIKEGLPHVNLVLQKQEFDTIRHDPLFQKLKKN